MFKTFEKILCSQDYRFLFLIFKLPLGHASGTATIPYNFPLPPAGIIKGSRLSPLFFKATSIFCLKNNC